mgnify:CR=1 FL=1
MLKVLIVDDEPLAHEVLIHHCRAHSGLEVVAQCRSAAEALAALERNPVDLMFLDVRMPRFGGIDLLRGLATPPLTVIVSAHRDHAFEGFELDVIDYLLKPVSAARFAEAVDKVRRRIAAASPGRTEPAQDIVLKVDRTLRRFVLDDVSLFQAQGNFVLVTGTFGSVLATTTLKALLEALPGSGFVQVHKSYIVRRGAISAQSAQTLMLADGTVVPIGKSFRGPVYIPRPG